ncbi:unnamed protein product [Prorocentrum cordatum]|uniref:Uncharacterized protein n=1 Tax=Prorocentrum cordatum TaxID=2364126 RepID=A0ABN9UJ26_9DINO|nr:unnamed protein product [Polarella glacialis]
MARAAPTTGAPPSTRANLPRSTSTATAPTTSSTTTPATSTTMPTCPQNAAANDIRMDNTDPFRSRWIGSGAPHTRVQKLGSERMHWGAAKCDSEGMNKYKGKYNHIHLDVTNYL